MQNAVHGRIETDQPPRLAQPVPHSHPSRQDLGYTPAY